MKVNNYYTFKYPVKIIGLVIVLLISKFAAAQTWSVPGKSLDIMMSDIVYIESVYPRPGADNSIKDTLTGTGFLIKDKNKVYIVTAKHIIQHDVNGHDQQLANDSVFTSASWKIEDKVYKLAALSGTDAHKSAVVFSPDEQDIAIISLQKRAYKSILTGLLKQEATAIPASSVSTSNVHQPGEQFFHIGFGIFKDKGKKVRSKGLAPGTVKTFDPKAPIFTINKSVNQGSDGSPVFLKGKIIGMVLRQEGISSNSDFLQNPYHTAETASVVKASYILTLLKKLQQNENTPGF